MLGDRIGPAAAPVICLVENADGAATNCVMSRNEIELVRAADGVVVYRIRCAGTHSSCCTCRHVDLEERDAVSGAMKLLCAKLPLGPELLRLQDRRDAAARLTITVSLP
jgi:hypothetical protein